MEMNTAPPENPQATTSTASMPAIEASPVLVVDDSRTMRLALTRELNKLGFTRITEAVDGRDAIEKIRRENFDLVLLDMEMPELDGMGVLLEIRNDPELRGLPVIVISGAEQVDAAVKCIEAGAEDYLPKPFNPTLLRARVTTSLEKKRLRDLDRIRLAQLQVEKDRLEEIQRRLDGELAEAANYVRSILPDPIDTPLRIDWKYQPSTELGGDAFGYHWIDPDHFAVYLLDVCGHGVGASLLSVTAINVIRGGALPGTDFRDPGAVLSGLNNAFLMEKQNNMYFTMWYGVYHVPSRTLKHASGGHPASLLMTPSSGTEAGSAQLRSPGLIIGAMEDTVYETRSCPVAPGETLLVLCDGCYEIKDAQGNFMEFETFEQFMRQHVAKADALDRLYDWVCERHGEGPLDDDFSIVRIKF
jgi:sigma-B regulation protein RsbU (phosphoserine phosphatase)